MKTYKRRVWSVLGQTVALLLVVLFVLPLIWVFITSLKTTAEVSHIPPTFYPHNPTFEVYSQLFHGDDGKQWLTFFFNSFKVVFPSTVITGMLAILAGYGFARFRIYGGTVLLVLLLVSQMLPGASILLPVSEMMQKLGLFDNHLGLIMVYVAISLPFTTWLAVNAFRGVPLEMEEAAKIDGCGKLRMLLRIFIPVTKPQMVTVVLIAFLEAWGEFPFALVLMQTPDHMTVPVAIARFVSTFETPFNKIGAISFILSIPTLAIFIFIQRFFVRGLIEGAGKEI